ncbi:MAG TPA: alkaline phosphatase family protein [Polyangia bacterium]|nr:alkaline phosphatase family protein [Polyangia bacterium]
MCAALALALVAGCDSPHDSGPCDGICPVSPINHLVVIVQENHTFDTYFGRYCTAATGSAPTCTDGPACCERAPDTDPGGASPIVLDDHANALYDPNHLSACEADEVDGGKMDHFVDSTLCGDARNFAYADASTVQPYWDLAAGGALADHWFQPVLGQSSSNDMFLFNAHFVFADNGIEPDAPGAQCSVVTSKPMSLGDTNTLGDKLDDGNITWTWYAEGFADMLNATARPGCPDAVGACCPDPPPDCGAGWQLYPCVFDPDDIPAAYYKRFANDPNHVRDYSSFGADVGRHTLPQVTFIKGLGYHTEHPGLSTTISDGASFVQSVVDRIHGSAYASNTLVLVVYDEGGGFFDHVAPPPAVDAQPYGTRIPAIAVGPFARKGTVSHVVLEHSSIVRFIEWNWLGDTRLDRARDSVVANIGSLLDPALGVPEDAN